MYNDFGSTHEGVEGTPHKIQRRQVKTTDTHGAKAAGTPMVPTKNEKAGLERRQTGEEQTTRKRRVDNPSPTQDEGGYHCHHPQRAWRQADERAPTWNESSTQLQSLPERQEIERNVTPEAEDEEQRET